MDVANAFADLLKVRRNRQGQAVGQLAVSVRTLKSVPDKLVEAIVAILEHMILVTASDHQKLQHQPSWNYRWKPISYEGFDMYRGHVLDYGNWTYRTLLLGLCNASERIAELVKALANSWPSLDPSATSPSAHAIEMQGDLIEIVLAALRAVDPFDDAIQPLLPRLNTTFPELFDHMAGLCKGLHMVRGYMVSGFVSYQSERVLKLVGQFPQDDPVWSPVWAVFVDMLESSGDDVGLACLNHVC